MITAPFNFVPLSEKVFFPDWASDVSHDVPFEDAQSGTIDITMTAKSPIFVRDGADEQGFCNHKGTAFIPASSVKGMVRNILEIMSFSKMSMFNDDTYAVRDLRNRELYMSKMTPDNTYCGWLKKSDDGYVIEDCGKPGRVKHEEIDKIYHMNFASKFKHGTFGNKAKDKIAKFKYELIKDENFTHKFSYFKKDVNREIYRYHENGKTEGTLVLTGQPSARKEPQGQKPSGKVYEFIFFESKGELKLTKDTYQNFLFAYFDGRKTEPKESPDWAFWKKKLEAGDRVPVFFQKNGKEVAHFGLSYLYKLPYTHSVKDGVPPAHNDSRRDLAETMFGYIGKEEALKGRVQFSHFKASSNAQSLAPRTEILGTPRASYYPMYVKQQEGKLFTTFMDGGFNISGWKRYPIHKNGVQKTTDTGNENVGTTFSPLKEGVVFQGKVRYHNLKKAELGALLSALSFHNTKGCFHNIGMAKSLGYGKVELKIDGIEQEEYLKAFEVEMSEQVGEWTISEQVQELLSMATEQENRGNSKLKYMELKGFADHKSKDKDFLRNYTMLEGISCVAPVSLITEADLEALRERQAKRLEQEILHQEQRTRNEQHKKEWEIVYASTNLSTIKSFVSKYPDSKYLETAKAKIAEIKQKLLNVEQEEAEAEAKAKWEAVQKVDKKFYKKALEDFIAKYETSTFVSDAKKELESLGGAIVSKATNQGLDFSKADDGKSIERAMKAVQNPSEEDKDKLEKVIKKVYPNLNAKKKKQFIKMKLMVKWLGDVRFDDVLYPDLKIIKDLESIGIGLTKYEDNEEFTRLDDSGYIIKNQKVVNFLLTDGSVSDFILSKICELSSLEVLNLSANNIKEGTIVDVDDNGVKITTRFDEIPKELSNLKSLKELYLSGNELYEFPKSILELTNLEVLDLSYNYIEKIPEELANLTKLRVLKLESNPIFNLKEIDSLKPQQLISTLLLTQNQVKRSLNEAKVLVLGHGGVGKTSLVNCIIDKKIDTTSTFGIEIGSHILSNDVKINIWDFAGQEITHQMHKFFLSKRSIYLLILNARTEESPMTWLEDIRERAGNAPIVIVVNKIDENRGYILNKNRYEKEFPNIQKVIYSSAKLGEEENIEELLEELELQTDKLQIVRDELPENWFLVKEELEKQYENRSDSSRKDNVVTIESFEDICESYDIDDENEQGSLLEILKQIGTVTDHLGSQNIALMNPNWITYALYKILRCSDDETNDVKINNGILNISDENLNKILGDDKRYKKRDYSELVDLLMKFEIAFRLNDNEILIASEISSNEPSYDDRYYERGLSLRYKYTYKLKKERFAKFIVKIKDYISLEEEVSYWSDGVFLKHNESEVVVQREDYAILVLFHSKDKDAREFLSIIRHIFRELNNDTKVREEIPLVDEEDENKTVIGYTRYEYILEQEKKGNKEVTIDVDNIGSMDFKIDNLLDGYREETRPLIITEGKTDWKHIKSALRYFKKNGKFEQLDIEFFEYNNINMGETKLEKRLKDDAEVPQSRLRIGIFDCDTKIGKKYEKEENQKLSDSVFAVSISTPEFRKYHNGICIEFLYKDDDLCKLDKNGRKIYLSEEFSAKGRLSSNATTILENANTLKDCLNKNKEETVKEKSKIIDSGVIDINDKNIALTKDNFAKNILEQVEPFDTMDFDGFSGLFRRLEEIIKESS